MYIICMHNFINFLLRLYNRGKSWVVSKRNFDLNIGNGFFTKCFNYSYIKTTNWTRTKPNCTAKHNPMSLIKIKSGETIAGVYFGAPQLSFCILINELDCNKLTKLFVTAWKWKSLYLHWINFLTKNIFVLSIISLSPWRQCHQGLDWVQPLTSTGDPRSHSHVCERYPHSATAMLSRWLKAVGNQ